MIKWKLRNVFEPSSSSLSCQKWVRTTHSNYVCMVCTFAILFYCQMLHFNDSIEWELGLYLKFHLHTKTKDIKNMQRYIPKVRTKHLDHNYCMPSSSTRPISRCYTLQWILWRTFANRIDLSSLKSNFRDLYTNN